jgi:hypothetical protein
VHVVILAGQSDDDVSRRRVLRDVLQRLEEAEVQRRLDLAGQPVHVRDLEIHTHRRCASPRPDGGRQAAFC